MLSKNGTARLGILLLVAQIMITLVGEKFGCKISFQSTISLSGAFLIMPFLSGIT
jgi:hypothetical protein